MDSGLCPGNYYDYLDDDIAKQRELELFDTWNGPGAFLGMWFVMWNLPQTVTKFNLTVQMLLFHQTQEVYILIR